MSGRQRRASTANRPLPRIVFLSVVVAASALIIGLSRGVFLYWDDFLFLGEARGGSVSRAYLDSPLFTHFSPVTRLLNILVADGIADHPWLIVTTLAVLMVSVIASVTWLMVVLHGRTRTALVGALVLAPSLTLLPLANWWTAGVNILPAMAGFLVSFGAMVLVVRGGSRWWAVPCLLGAGVGVLDYELPMLLPGYLGLWVLLFRDRLGDEPFLTMLRRTWWLWVGLVAVCGAAAVNYRLNYYAELPAPSIGAVLHAMGRSLVRTLVPTTLGLHDPRSGTVSELSLVVGCLALVALVGWLLWTRPNAWRGLLFAAVGWALPTLALIVNRVDIYGVAVVDNVIYFFLPSVLALVGVLEAWASPRRLPAGPVDVTHGWGRVLVPTLLVAVVAAYAVSAGPTSRYQLPPGTGPEFVQRARASAEQVEGAKPLNVLDSDVPQEVVPPQYVPFNRASNVLGLTVPHLIFDQAQGPYYRADATGVLREVRIAWQLETSKLTTATREVKLRSVQDLEYGEHDACFITNDRSAVLWTLPRTVSGAGLVIRPRLTVDRTTPLKAAVLADGVDSFAVANVDSHDLRPGVTPSLETVVATSARAVLLHGFDDGVRLCLSGLDIGLVTASG